MDGKLWKSLGSFSGVAFPNTIYAGLSAGSTANNGGAVSTYEHIAVRSAGAPPTDGVVSVLGRAAAVGSVAESLPGVVTLSGNGLNIGGQNPDFLFLQKPFSQDGEIKVRISDLSALGGNTNAGIMIRDSLQPGAVYFFHRAFHQRLDSPAHQLGRGESHDHFQTSRPCAGVAADRAPRTVVQRVFVGGRSGYGRRSADRSRCQWELTLSPA